VKFLFAIPTLTLAADFILVYYASKREKFKFNDGEKLTRDASASRTRRLAAVLRKFCLVLLKDNFTGKNIKNIKKQKTCEEEKA
jgi:hypothetical protein